MEIFLIKFLLDGMEACIIMNCKQELLGIMELTRKMGKPIKLNTISLNYFLNKKE